MTAATNKPETKSDSSSAIGSRSVALVGNRIDSSELFASGREITIAHGSDVYHLRLTSQNKLILTK